MENGTLAGGLVGVGGLILAALGAFYGRRRDKSADWAAFTAAVHTELENCREESRQLRADMEQQRRDCDERTNELERRIDDLSRRRGSGGMRRPTP